MTALVVDNIGLLVTNDPELGEGPLGLVRDAALVLEGGRVAAIERGRRRRRRAHRRRRALRDPGLRRQPHPPRLRRRPRRRVRRPDGGRAVRGRRDPRDDRGDPRRQRRRAAARSRERRRDEGLRAGITHLEIKSGYGLDVATEQRLLRDRRPS